MYFGVFVFWGGWGRDYEGIYGVLEKVIQPEYSAKRIFVYEICWRRQVIVYDEDFKSFFPPIFLFVSEPNTKFTGLLRKIRWLY